MVLDAMQIYKHNILSEKFIKETYQIEGEEPEMKIGWKAIKYVEDKGINNLKDVLKIHKIFTKNLDVDWGGKLREVNVRVGNYVAPNHTQIKKLMKMYFKDFPKMDSFEAYCRFEQIHPFRDYNGRVGRFIWLSKALDEGYDYSISFLHKFHYQTLNKYV